MPSAACSKLLSEIQIGQVYLWEELGNQCSLRQPLAVAYRLLFFNVKPFSFIRSIDIRSI